MQPPDAKRLVGIAESPLPCHRVACAECKPEVSLDIPMKKE